MKSIDKIDFTKRTIILIQYTIMSIISMKHSTCKNRHLFIIIINLNKIEIKEELHYINKV